MMVMAPLWAPADRPLGFTPTFTEPRLLPDTDVALLSVSHVLLEEAVHVNVPGPLLEIVRACVAGAAPFWTAENDMVDGFRAIVGVVTMGLGSSYAAICATPGISEKRRLMLAGAFGADKPESAAAVRCEGVAIPISGDDVDAVVGSICPTNGEASGVASDIGMADLLALVSFDCADVFSWVAGDEGVAELAVGVTGANSTKGFCTLDVVVAGVGRRINRWDFLDIDIAGLVSAEKMLPVCLALD